MQSRVFGVRIRNEERAVLDELVAFARDAKCYATVAVPCKLFRKLLHLAKPGETRPQFIARCRAERLCVECGEDSSTYFCEDCAFRKKLLRCGA